MLRNSTTYSHRRLSGWVITMLTVTATMVGTSTYGQVNKLDKDKLIEALANEGMQELLGHLIDVEPPSDVAEAKEIQAKTQLSLYKNEQLPISQRVEALSQYRQSMRDLIDQHRDHSRRPIWQTDLAYVLLFDDLVSIHRSAAEFYEFGVTTVSQRQTFEDTAVDALQLLSDASLRLFELQTQLPRRADFQQFRDSGLYDRLMREYAQRRTPYLLAHAAHYAALAPAEHRYYQTLRENAFVVADLQAEEPADEKKRLHQQTIDDVQGFADDQSDPMGIRAAACSLMGRAYLGLLDYDRAQRYLNKAIDATGATLDNLIAHMALAKTLFEQGQTDDAVQTAAKLADHALVREQVLLRLLVADLHHRLLLAQVASEKAEGTAISEAYEVYVDLLSDSVLGENAKTMKQLVTERWSESIPPDADLSDLPNMVVLALGGLALDDGRNLIIDADMAVKANDNAQASALRDEGLVKLRYCSAINRDVLQREKISRAQRANAMANLAYATYFAGQGDLAQLLASTEILTNLADQMPDQAIAEQAIVDAVALLREAYEQLGAQRPVDLTQGYERAAHVLLEKFGTTEAADNERLYFAFFVLQTSRRFGEAAQVYSQIPQMHHTYWQGQRERLFCLLQVYKNADRTNKAPSAQQIHAASRDLLERIQRQWSITAAELHEDMKRCEGTAHLVLADLALDAQNYRDATEWLLDFEREFADLPELVRDAYEKRIAVYLATDQLDEATSESTSMMRAFPDDAGEVIGNVLDQMDQRIDRFQKLADEQVVAAKKEAQREKAQNTARNTRKLADLLLTWATEQGFDEEQMLAYKLIMVRALRLTGEVEQAVQQAQALLAMSPYDANVIHESAESVFALRSPDTLKQALVLYRKLYDGQSGLRPDEDGRYPRMWWNAWLRQLQITEILKGKTENIPLLVNQLEMTDSGLGGEPYASELRRMRNKYSG